MARARPKIGELLIQAGIITEAQLDEALSVQRQEGSRLGDVLVRQRSCTERELVEALSQQLGMPHASHAKGLLQPSVDQGLEKMVPEDFARAHLVLPITRNMNSLTVAFVDPSDLITIDNLRRMSSCEINPIIATRTDLLKAITEFYGERSLLEEAIKDSYELEVGDAPTVDEQELLDEDNLSLDELIAKAEEAPVVKLVDLILKQAIDDRASDIHIEPTQKRLNVRYRIDGVLYEIPPPARHLLLPLVSRIKILSRLDIAEKRLPQDGGFTVREEDRLIDLRVSTIPVIYGEKVVIRILDKSATPLDLNELGFESKAQERFQQAIKHPYGMILITGPTGSGKTTTLYAALSTINTPHKNLTTIEDPVEYKLDGINQVQARPTIGLTFAGGLRAFLRQDPDVIMVGEVRDMETAEICVKAALTGHLVLSTLHTNDAVGAISRLINIGIEPFLVTSSLSLVAAQRLVRRLCHDCKEAYEPSSEVLAETGLRQDLLYRAKGCEKCSQTGYLGRAAIYEVLSVDKEIKALIARGAADHEIKERARALGMETLWESALKKVGQGVTSLEEASSATISAGEI